MKNQQRTRSGQIPEILDTPAYPKTGSEIVRGLETAVDEKECLPGQYLTQKRFAELTGIPKATLNDWHHGRLVEQIKRFVCGLERLNEPQRTAFVGEFCRDCPRLHDPRLSHDPGAVNGLKALVQQHLGLVLVAGPSDMARTFVITAMANSAGADVRACGLDIHRPDTFVPISGVSYLKERLGPTQLRAVVRKVWPQFLRSESQLLVLNGIWSAVPGFRTKIATVALDRNVIVADDFGPEVARLRQWPKVQSTLVTVSFRDRSEHQLDVRIESLRT